jgi:hypothetical protein
MSAATRMVDDPLHFGLRASGFGLLSVFGPRISDFGFRISACRVERCSATQCSPGGGVSAGLPSEVSFGRERGSPDPLKADIGVVLGAGRRPALLAVV